jgi:hypothetical protein
MKELKEFLDAAGGVGGLATDTRPSMTRQGACGFACTAYSPNAMRRGDSHNEIRRRWGTR